MSQTMEFFSFFFFFLLFDWLVQTLISMRPKCAAWFTNTTDEQALCGFLMRFNSCMKDTDANVLLQPKAACKAKL